MAIASPLLVFGVAASETEVVVEAMVSANRRKPIYSEIGRPSVDPERMIRR